MGSSSVSIAPGPEPQEPSAVTSPSARRDVVFCSEYPPTYRLRPGGNGHANAAEACLAPKRPFATII